MDSKQSEVPPAYTETANAPNPYNPGGPGSNQPPQSYPPPSQGGYPAGYVQQAGYPPQQPYVAPGGYAYQQTVVMNQPMAQGMTVQSNVPDNMGLAIFTTICCCWPLGLAAIMKAQESRRALAFGDIASAQTYSSESRRYSMWAIAGGCVSIVLAIVIVVIYITVLLR